MHNVLRIVIERKAAMSQSEHSITMGMLTGQKAGTAWRAGWRCRKCLSEQYSFLRQALNMWRRNGVSVGLNIASRIMRMDIENIWSLCLHITHHLFSRVNDALRWFAAA